VQKAVNRSIINGEVAVFVAWVLCLLWLHAYCVTLALDAFIVRLWSELVIASLKPVKISSIGFRKPPFNENISTYIASDFLFICFSVLTSIAILLVRFRLFGKTSVFGLNLGNRPSSSWNHRCLHARGPYLVFFAFFTQHVDYIFDTLHSSCVKAYIR